MNLFSPAQIAENYVSIGKSKVNTAIPKMFLLAVMAGVFIALGGVGATTAAVGVQPAAIGKLLGACIFPGGLTMVLLAGSELFSGEVSLPGVLRNWIVVYLGNFAGGLLVAAGAVYSHQLRLFGNGMAVSVISTAAGKCTMSFSDALIRGVFCNFLVCIAVWISFAAKDAAGKVIGLFFPIMIFVLCGFEHSVANMYYIGAGLMARTVPEYLDAALAAGLNPDVINLGNFLFANLLPVTIGNVLGGVCVGGVYWLAYLRKAD